MIILILMVVPKVRALSSVALGAFDLERSQLQAFSGQGKGLNLQAASLVSAFIKERLNEIGK